MNDLPVHTKFYVNLFADDTVLLLKNKNIHELQEQLSDAQKRIDDGMKYNRLSVNYSKATYFVAHPKRKISPLAQFELKIREHALLKKNNTKYLGVIIDQDLKWHVHIENVIKKLAGAAKILCKIRHYVDKKTLVNLYYAFAYPGLGTRSNFIRVQVRVQLFLASPSSSSSSLINFYEFKLKFEFDKNKLFRVQVRVQAEEYPKSRQLFCRPCSCI